MIDEQLLNKLLRDYFDLIARHSQYNVEDWRTNTASTVECKRILLQISQLLEQLLRDSKVITEPFEVRFSDGAGNFPKNPWIGVFRPGESPKRDYYPLMGLHGYKGFFYIACVKAKNRNIIGWEERFGNLSRCKDDQARSEVMSTGLDENPNVAMPATIFRRGWHISSADFVEAWKRAEIVYKEVYEYEAKNNDSVAKLHFSDEKADVAVPPTNSRLEAISASLKDIEFQQEQIQIKGRLGLENIDKLRVELATLKQSVEDSKSDVDKVRRTTALKIEEVTNQVKVDATSLISDYLKTQEAKCKDIELNFKSILERATVGVLSAEFEAKRDEQEVIYRKMKSLFYSTLMMFGILGLFMVVINNFDVKVLQNVNQPDPIIYLKNLPHIAMFFTPIYLPMIWFVCHVNKLMNQSRRLMEEYAHKVVVSKSYMGLAKQTEDLLNNGVDSARDVNAKLLQQTIAVLCRNPNGVLDRVRTETPLAEAVDLFTKAASAAKS